VKELTILLAFGLILGKGQEIRLWRQGLLA
jgi:hypothetical protein